MSSKAESHNNSWFEHLAREAPHSIRHVSIRQLLKAHLPYEKALFTIDGKEFKTVIVVGNVLDKTVAPNQIAYRLEDGSGRIMARCWRDPNQDASDSMDDDSELRFVRAVGVLNEFKSARGLTTRSLILQSLEYIQDPHEVFHHISQTIVDTQMSLHGQPPMASVKPTLAELSNELQELDLVPIAEATEDEDLQESAVRSIDPDSVLETPARVRKIRNLSPPPSPTPRPRASKQRRYDSPPRSDSNAEASSSKIPDFGLAYAPTTPTVLKSPQMKESIDLESIVLSIISDRMRTLRTSRPAFTYEGVGRDDVIKQVLNCTQSTSVDQVKYAYSIPRIL
ncbi:hypothetical protein FB446DRAFT_750014 [Lentinula raphanica]|nr:hypothetical protein FB446DRAFT_750014 [Lentinula raphanica]